MVKQKVVIGGFRHAESKSGLYFVLTLLLHRFLATFQSKHMTVFACFPSIDWILGKTRQSNFPEYTPLKLSDTFCHLPMILIVDIEPFSSYYITIPNLSLREILEMDFKLPVILSVVLRMVLGTRGLPSYTLYIQ